ncbi:FecR family protein [Parasphingorhabdus sp.]
MKKITQIVAAAVILTASPVLAETPKWKISESNGTVNVLRSGVSKIAISGGSLQAGDIVSTAGKSRAVLVRGQEYVVVSPNSRVRISAPKQSGGIMQFFQEIGNAVFRIDKKATPHFGVETPYLAAVVKGTTFSVTVTDTGSAVQVTEGAVQVSTPDGGATQLLSPGMIGMVSNDQRFKLVITGAESRTIISSNAPANGKAPLTGEDSATPTEIATESSDGVITAPIADTPVSLSDLTGGLVTGGTTAGAPVQLAMNDVSLPFGSEATNSGSNTNPGTFGIGNGSSSSESSSNIVGGTGSDEGDDGKGSLIIPPVTSEPGAGQTAGNTGSSGNSGAGSNTGGGATAGLNAGNGGGNENAGAGTGNGNANGGSGPNYGGDQPGGTCSGVPNCHSGPNPNTGSGGGTTASNPATGGGNGNGNNGVGNGNGGANGTNANAGGDNGNSNGGGSRLKEILTALYNGYQEYKNGNNAGGGKD